MATGTWVLAAGDGAELGQVGSLDDFSSFSSLFVAYRISHNCTQTHPSCIFLDILIERGRSLTTILDPILPVTAHL